MLRPKVAVMHPRLGLGGSESLALWTAEALKDRVALSLVTGGPVDLARLNEFYGTHIEPGEIEIINAPLPLELGRTEKFAALRGAVFQKYCRSIAPRFDLVINTYGLCNFTVPAIQCVADFGFVREWRNHLSPELAGCRRWWYGDSLLRRAYLNLCDGICRCDPEASKSNLTLANSRWTAKLLKQKLGIDSEVVYPPVSASAAIVPWEEQENGFLCIGRVVPEKRMDSVVEILSRLRQRGHDIHLHILGGVDDSPFGRKIRLLAERNRNRVLLEGSVWGARKAQMLANHRYGINGRSHEPFGIAVAEMVKAGCVTFVPNGGGQAEIVDHPALAFENVADAVAKIENVLLIEALRQDLRRHLARQAQSFSTDKFQTTIRQIVRGFLERKQAPSGAVFSTCPPAQP
jgi:glycosyltransferase involved in cell wall biosynthesis